MKLGFFSTFTMEHTFAEACQLAADIGYAGVQPRVAPGPAYDPDQPLNPWGNNRCTIPEQDFLDDPVAAVKPARDVGLEVISLPSYCSVADPERSKRLVCACEKAGIRGMRLGALPLPEHPGLVDVPGLLEQSRQRFAAVLETARAAGVRLNLELHMHGLANSPAAALELLRDFDPADVGVIYDPGNMVHEGYEPARVAVGRLGPYLAEVHVKNAVWVRDATQPEGQQWRCMGAALNDGIADWRNTLRILRDAGYDGWLIEEDERHDIGLPAGQRLADNHRLLSGWIEAARSE